MLPAHLLWRLEVVWWWHAFAYKDLYHINRSCLCRCCVNNVQWNLCAMTKWLVRLGTLSKDAHWHKKLDNVQMFALAGFACLFYEYFCKRFVLFFASDFSFSGSSHVVGLLLMKSRKGLAYDIMNISAAHDLVHDIKCTECQTQNGIIHGCIFKAFKQFLTD